MLGGTAVLSSSQCNSSQQSSCPECAHLISNSCACQPLSGKVYQHFSLKWTYLGCLAVFEIGSLICATSPSSVVLIIGRAVAGLGAAGLFSGALVIIAHTLPLRLRPSELYFFPSALGIHRLKQSLQCTRELSAQCSDSLTL
jgi:hypothetical protein